MTSDHLFFFFQAEDGIRDSSVTGVQTCALPISCRSAQGRAGSAEHQAERHGAGDRAEATGKWRAEAAEREHAVEACDRRGADRHRDLAAGLTLQRLYELPGARSGGPSACREFPLRTLADCG